MTEANSPTETIPGGDGRIVYADFVTEVAQNRRSNVIGLASSLSWAVWDDPQFRKIPMSRPIRKDLHFVEAYAGRIGAIGAAVCREDAQELGQEGCNRPGEDALRG